MSKEKLEVMLQPKKIREHFKNPLHQLCRIVDYYKQELGMNFKDALYCAKQKYRKLYK